MKTRTKVRFALLVCLVCWSTAVDESEVFAEGCEGRMTCTDCTQYSLQLHCPDDYCSKPMPCLPRISYCTALNDYCCKPLPCLLESCQPVCPDHYCHKPIPCLRWQPVGAAYRCGTSGPTWLPIQNGKK